MGAFYDLLVEAAHSNIVLRRQHSRARGDAGELPSSQASYTVGATDRQYLAEGSQSTEILTLKPSLN